MNIPSQDYWTKRALERENKWNSIATKTIEDQIEVAYAHAVQDLSDRVFALYGKYAKDNKLSMAQARQIIQGNEFQQWRMSMQEYMKRYEDTKNNMVLLELNTLAMRTRISRLEKLMAQCLMKLNDLNQANYGDLTELIKKCYEDNYYRNMFDMNKYNVGVAAAMDPEKLENILRDNWSGVNYSKRIWHNQDKIAFKIKDVVTRNILHGQNAKKMTNDIAACFGASKFEATRLVRTELNYALNKANLDSVEDAGLDKVEFRACLDNRTSQICRQHDGSIVEVRKASAGLNVPPMHPLCRSCTVAYFEGLPPAKRMVKDDKGKTVIVPSNMTYEGWKEVFVDKKTTLAEWQKANPLKTVVRDKPRSYNRTKKTTPPTPENKPTNVGINDGIKQAKDVKEAYKMLVDDVGFMQIAPTLKKNDKDLIVANTNQLIKLEEKYNVVHNGKFTISGRTSRRHKFASAYVELSSVNGELHQELSLCPISFLKKADHIKFETHSIENGYHMPCKAENILAYTVTHEYGHMLHNNLIYGEFKVIHAKQPTLSYSGFMSFRIDEFKEEIIEIAKKNNKNFDLDKNISKYGKSNSYEFFAECFANANLGKPNELGKAMQQWLKGKGY